MNSKSNRLINHCFREQINRCKDSVVKFTFTEYENFWKDHQPGKIYELKNRNGSTEICHVAYFPLNCTYVHDEKDKEEKKLKYHDDLYALIEIKIKDGTDFREVPVRFLTAKNE